MKFNAIIVRDVNISVYSTAIHTIAHWYNYERFVAFNPPISPEEFGLEDTSFVPIQSTVVLEPFTVS